MGTRNRSVMDDLDESVNPSYPDTTQLVLHRSSEEDQDVYLDIEEEPHHRSKIMM